MKYVFVVHDRQMHEYLHRELSLNLPNMDLIYPCLLFCSEKGRDGWCDSSVEGYDNALHWFYSIKEGDAGYKSTAIYIKEGEVIDTKGLEIADLEALYNLLK